LLVIYQHPLAYLLGLEGVALLRGFAGHYDREFTEARLAEVRALLTSADQFSDGVETRPITTREGYRAWAGQSAQEALVLPRPGSTVVSLLASSSDYPHVSGQLKVPQQLTDIGTMLNRPPEKPPVLLQTAVAGFHDHAGYVFAGVDLLACCPASPQLGVCFLQQRSVLALVIHGGNDPVPPLMPLRVVGVPTHHITPGLVIIGIDGRHVPSIRQLRLTPAREGSTALSAWELVRSAPCLLPDLHG